MHGSIGTRPLGLGADRLNNSLFRLPQPSGIKLRYGIHAPSPHAHPPLVRLMRKGAAISLFIVFNAINCLPMLGSCGNDAWFWALLGVFNTEIVAVTFLSGMVPASRPARFIAAIISLATLLATQTIGLASLPTIGSPKDALQIVPVGIGVFTGARLSSPQFL